MRELDAVSGEQCKHAGREVRYPLTSVAHLMLKQRHKALAGFIPELGLKLVAEQSLSTTFCNT